MEPSPGPRLMGGVGRLLPLLAAALQLGDGRAAPPRRNILFLLADDGGFEFPMWGNNVTHTPNIARLAAMGTVFDRAYTAVSSCSPSRSAILSGLPTHQNGMYGLHTNPGNFQSYASVVGLPTLLNRAGYKTGILGKYHLGPVSSYNFTYGLTEEHCWAGAIKGTEGSGDGFTCPHVPGAARLCQADYNSVTRNITNLKLHAREFLTELEPEKPFFLYVGFGDCHRCGGPDGEFCEKYGSGGSHGTMPGWTPRLFRPEDVTVPWFLPDNAAVRSDLAAQYTSVNRLDQGVGLVLEELESAGHFSDTLIIYFSDNGVPFPSGKTNLYEQGQAEPLVIVAPGLDSSAQGVRSKAVVSSLDFLPTLLAWAGAAEDTGAGARRGAGAASYTGSSLLPLLGRQEPPKSWRNAAFGSHQFHSLYAYYPMRCMVNERYRLVHNLLPSTTFPILEDVYITKTWTDIRRAAYGGQATGWIYNYTAYMRRPRWELFDLEVDPHQQVNLAEDAEHSGILQSMQHQLEVWRKNTSDPWLMCSNPGLSGQCSGDDDLAELVPPPSLADLIL